MESLWAPRGVRPCGGAESCAWALEGDACACRPGKPCLCERKLFDRLTDEGSAFFGGAILSGLVARSLIETARATLTGDPKAEDRRLDLLRILLPDRRKAEDLAQRERRLAIEEARARPRGPALAEYLASRAAPLPPGPIAAPTLTDTRIPAPDATAGQPGALPGILSDLPGKHAGQTDLSDTDPVPGSEPA